MPRPSIAPQPTRSTFAVAIAAGSSPTTPPPSDPDALETWAWALPAMPPRQPSPASSRKDAGKTTGRDDGDYAEGDEATSKKTKKSLGAKRGTASSRGKKGGAEEDEGGAGGAPQREPDRVRVFLKISAETGTSVSSCVTCDSKSNTAWALDFDGQRNGQVVTLDGVYGADSAEQSVYPDVVHGLVNEFMGSSRGVGSGSVGGDDGAGVEWRE